MGADPVALEAAKGVGDFVVEPELVLCASAPDAAISEKANVVAMKFRIWRLRFESTSLHKL
jgi:hypothetical protein